jgi:hypothetical protein
MELRIIDTPWLRGVTIAHQPLAFDALPDPACTHIDASGALPGAEAETLRQEFGLAAVIANCGNDLSRATALCSWVHSRWQHVSNNPAKTGSAVEILRRAQGGERFRCAEYGFVLGRVLNAVGLPSRSLGLRTLDVETRLEGAGHVGTEVYLRDQKRWTFFDPQFDMVTLAGGLPLSAVELQREMALGTTVEFRTSTATAPRKYQSIITPYLMYFDFNAPQHGNPDRIWHLMLVPKGLTAPQAFEGVAETYPLRLATRSTATFYPTATAESPP